MKSEKIITENYLINFFGKILITKYNFSLVILTILWWLVCYGWVYNSNNNYDMTLNVNNYIIYLSLVCIGATLRAENDQYRHVTHLGVICLILSIIALITIKSLVTHSFGAFIAAPLSFFCCLLLLKNIWLISLQKNDVVKII